MTTCNDVTTRLIITNTRRQTTTHSPHTDTHSPLSDHHTYDLNYIIYPDDITRATYERSLGLAPRVPKSLIYYRFVTLTILSSQEYAKFYKILNEINTDI